MSVLNALCLFFTFVVVVFSFTRVSLNEKTCNGSSCKILTAIMSHEKGLYKLSYVIIFITIILNTFFITFEQEIGFVSTFGYNRIIDNPGIHVKLPFFSENIIYDSKTFRIPIGFEEDSDDSSIKNGLMLTSSSDLVDVNFYIDYVITDPVSYYYSENDNLARSIAQTSIRYVIKHYDSSIMNTENSFQDKMEKDVYLTISDALKKHYFGIKVKKVTLVDVKFPNDAISNVFRAIDKARSDAETQLSNAKKYKDDKISETLNEIKNLEKNALDFKEKRIREAINENIEFEHLFTVYNEDPTTVAKILFDNTLQEILPGIEITIDKDTKAICIRKNYLS